MKQNAFRQDIPEIKDILKIDTVRDYIQKTLISVLETLETASPKDIVADVLKIAESSDTKEDYEKRAHSLLEKEGVAAKIPQKLSGRAGLIYSQISPYIAGKSVLDLGCGDGKVGERIAKAGLEVTLADVYEHSHIKDTGLRFVGFKQGDSASLREQYDTTLVLTVFHHSEEPVQTLQEAVRLTKKGGKVLVIESVYGIEDKSEFGRLECEEQRLANIFFDHFYNRVIHYSADQSKKVSVPFNFRTPEQWKELFEKHGLEQEKVEHLGIDQKTVPEYHTLHVLRVK